MSQLSINDYPGPEVIKLFMLNWARNYPAYKNCWHFNILQHLRDFKQETFLFVCILVIKRNWNFVLSWVEHEKSFITSKDV